MSLDKHLLRKTVLRRVVLITVAALVFVVVSLTAAHAYFRWTGNSYFGEIIAIERRGFTIREREHVERMILVTDRTIMKRGRKTLQNGLSVGEAVIVIGDPASTGAIEAKLIRVVREQRNGALRPASPPR